LLLLALAEEATSIAPAILALATRGVELLKDLEDVLEVSLFDRLCRAECGRPGMARR
jgi:hypothetical protein